MRGKRFLNIDHTGCSWFVQYFMVIGGEAKDKKSEGVGGGPPFNARCLGLHISVGGEDLH